MPSPFLGMDPYLEDSAYWQDFHRSFLTYCRDAQLDHLPDAYDARIDEHIRLVEHKADRASTVIPDVTITRETCGQGGTALANPPSTIASIAAAPNKMPLDADEVHDAWIEIRLRRDRSLVTAIELLSPANKTGVGYSEYRDKRINLRYRHAHLVEIDLLLGGRRLDLSEPLPAGDYFAYVTRADRHPHVDVYAWSIRDKLPTIPIPLKAADPDIGLNIAEVFAVTYERGRYARSLPYNAAPAVALHGETLTWATERGSGVKG
jgi:hypothetical protein